MPDSDPPSAASFIAQMLLRILDDLTTFRRIKRGLMGLEEEPDWKKASEKSEDFTKK